MRFNPKPTKVLPTRPRWFSLEPDPSDTADVGVANAQLKRRHISDVNGAANESHGELYVGVFAKESAKYFAEKQWGITNTEDRPEPGRGTITQRGQNIRDTIFTRDECDCASKKMKVNKAPGQDRVHMELWKWLSYENKIKLFNQLNRILETGIWDEHLNYANVVSIYKNGDSSLMENYRPISPSQTAYRMLASMIESRIANALDAAIKPTQYVFRKTKSTSHALFLTRRIQDRAEKQGKRNT